MGAPDEPRSGILRGETNRNNNNNNYAADGGEFNWKITEI